MKYEPLKLKDLKQNVREIFADKEKFAYIQNSAQRKMDQGYFWDGERRLCLGCSLKRQN